MKTNFDKEMDCSINFIKNLDKTLINSGIDDKRKVLSSIFTEKLVYSENKLLNFFHNEFLSLIFQNVNELQNKKRDKKEKISSLPHSVVRERLLSRLFIDSCFRIYNTAKSLQKKHFVDFD